AGAPRCWPIATTVSRIAWRRRSTSRRSAGSRAVRSARWRHDPRRGAGRAARAGVARTGARPARHARPRDDAGRPAGAHRLARTERHRERVRRGRRGPARRRERLLRLAAGVKARPTPRVLYVLWPDPLLVPGRDSHLTELIELAGGRSITAEERVQYVRFSIEAAVARAPEVIVLADHSSGVSTAGRAAPERWQAPTSAPAIRAGRLYSVDLSILHRYGPRVPEGLEILARLIHPEAFR